MSTELLVDIPEACRRLKVGKSYLYQHLIQPGRLRVVRFGRAVRIPVSELEHLVRELTEPAVEDV